MQLYEVLLSLSQSRRFQDGLRPLVTTLFACSLRYMQITARQQGDWEDDPGLFFEEDEGMEEGAGLSVRASAASLVHELIGHFGQEAVPAFLGCVEKQLEAAAAARARGDAGWWRLREACLFALAFNRRFLRAAASPFDAAATTASFLREDLLPAEVPELLRARALRLGVAFSRQVRGTEQPAAFLRAALAGLHAEDYGPLRVTSCVCLGRLCASLPPEETRPCVRQMLQGLMRFLQDADEDLTHVALECLAVVIKVDGAVSAAAVGEIGTAVMRGWSNFVNDPVISTVVLEVFAAFAAIPECQTELHALLVPAAEGVLRDPGAQCAVVEGMLDLTVALLQECGEDLARAAFGKLFAHIVHRMVRTPPRAHPPGRRVCEISLSSRRTRRR